ncbi:hypothetical protein NSP_21600 [Nodularia spumigena CCY9414]|nr:hypothetical protein NSP_21600 [Nodularia spumigena CCY9414]
MIPGGWSMVWTGSENNRKRWRGIAHRTLVILYILVKKILT